MLRHILFPVIRNTVLDFLKCSPSYAHRHLDFTNSCQFIFHDHNTLKWFLICVAGFRLLDRYFLGTSQYGVQLKNSQCLKIILCSMFTGLNNRDHSDVDVLLKR